MKGGSDATVGSPPALNRRTTESPSGGLDAQVRGEDAASPLALGRVKRLVRTGKQLLRGLTVPGMKGHADTHTHALNDLTQPDRGRQGRSEAPRQACHWSAAAGLSRDYGKLVAAKASHQIAASDRAAQAIRDRQQGGVTGGMTESGR